jgi:uncharacterized small protein (DUF1192 family)
MIDDEEPRPKPRRVTPLPLDALGVGELTAYIDEPRGEIARAAAEIARKEHHRSAAAAFFKPKT